MVGALHGRSRHPPGFLGGSVAQTGYQNCYFGDGICLEAGVDWIDVAAQKVRGHPVSVEQRERDVAAQWAHEMQHSASGMLYAVQTLLVGRAEGSQKKTNVVAQKAHEYQKIAARTVSVIGVTYLFVAQESHHSQDSPLTMNLWPTGSLGLLSGRVEGEVRTLLLVV